MVVQVRQELLVHQELMVVQVQPVHQVPLVHQELMEQLGLQVVYMLLTLFQVHIHKV
jgi:hypothetical protein